MTDDLAASTTAVVVVYRMAAGMEALLEALAASVGGVLVVDNSEHGHAALAVAAARRGVPLLRGGNVGALAGAYNLALRHLQAQGAAARHVLFVDEDSDASVLRPFLADAQTRAALQRPDTAAVAPAYRDRATGLRGKYIVLGRFRLRYLSREFRDLQAVAFVINSMSVWRLDMLQRIGPFDEGLAIDHVDTEYCLRARALGLRLYVHGGHEFAHSIGERRRFRFLGREMQAGGHPPARRYLIGRNTAWLARSWLWREPAFAFLCLTRLAYEVVGVLVAEEQAGAKLAALLRGAAAGLLMPRPA
jgi:rhamnosyltransferase